MLTKLAPYRKTVVAALGAVLVVLAQVAPFLPGKWQAVASAVLTLCTALGVYHVPNESLSPAEPTVK